MIPGMPAQFYGVRTYVIDTPQDDLDLWVFAGSPAYTLRARFYVDALCKSTDAANAAIDGSNFALNSIIEIIVRENVRGQGGRGGDGSGVGPNGTVTNQWGGGGGGGAGGYPGVNTGGFGGLGRGRFANPYSNTSDGRQGDEQFGGAGGNAEGALEAFPSPTYSDEGAPGGDAISVGDVRTLLYVEAGATLWGGGGGGGGGGAGSTFSFGGGTGGNPGQAGGRGGSGSENPFDTRYGSFGGAAGYAARGSDLTLVSDQSGGGILGTVGP